jgi:hypothetical protein
MSETVRHAGFIDFGRMGAALARTILKAGFTHKVYTRTAGKMQPFPSMLARWVEPLPPKPPWAPKSRSRVSWTTPMISTYVQGIPLQA